MIEVVQTGIIAIENITRIVVPEMKEELIDSMIGITAGVLEMKGILMKWIYKFNVEN